MNHPTHHTCFLPTCFPSHALYNHPAPHTFSIHIASTKHNPPLHTILTKKDVKKALNIVPCHILKWKILDTITHNSKNWPVNFQSDCQAQVKNINILSTTKLSLNEVPLKSILFPTLFKLFFLDLSTSRNSILLSYADDLDAASKYSIISQATHTLTIHLNHKPYLSPKHL